MPSEQDKFVPVVPDPAFAFMDSLKRDSDWVEDVIHPEIQWELSFVHKLLQKLDKRLQRLEEIHDA